MSVSVSCKDFVVIFFISSITFRKEFCVCLLVLCEEGGMYFDPYK